MDIEAPTRSADAGVPLRRPQAIYEALVQRIAEGQLRPGCRLTERHLVDEFAVSRTVVREALAKLQACGLVTTRQGRGTTVLRPANGLCSVHTALLEVDAAVARLDFRLGLETEAAALAARRRTASDLRRLDAAARNRTASLARAVDFHLAVASAAHNRLMLDLLTSMLTMPTWASAAQCGLDAVGSCTCEGHRVEVVEAIRREDPAAAAAAMRLHLRSERARWLRFNVAASPVP